MRGILIEYRWIVVNYVYVKIVFAPYSWNPSDCGGCFYLKIIIRRNVLEFTTDFAKEIFKSKYLLDVDDGNIDNTVERAVLVIARYYPQLEDKAREYINKKWFLPGGGIWRAANNPYKNISFINCTTLEPVEDNLESIFESLYYWAKFAAFGQGEGIDISNLRPKGSILRNTAKKSTGAVSFMPLYDSALNVIAQQGRRGASLISIHDTHPDIEDFCHIKDEEGQVESANISVQISDAFMKAVKNDDDWLLYWDDGRERIEKKVKAKELFDMIAEHAWKSGDPGVQFSDIMHRESNSDVLGFPVVSSNACSEQILDPHNTCLLGSINLAKYYEYGDELFEDVIELGIYALDAFRRAEYDESRSPSPIQREKLLDLPRIGLGVTGLADYFIRNNIAYGSSESIYEADTIFSTLVKVAHKSSHDIAKKDGHSFKYYDKEKYKQSTYIKRLLDKEVISNDILDMQAHVCKTTVAPNGTLSIIAECGGSGIEPLFSLYMVRRERATSNEWKEWFMYNQTVESYFKENDLELTKENVEKLKDNPLWITAHDLDNITKIDLMSTIQQYIDSAISVTYNLPEKAVSDDIKNIYLRAWEKGLKAVSVYREGSKFGVMITESNYDSYKNQKPIMPASPQQEKERVAPKRPENLPCDIYTISVNKEKHVVLVGMFNEWPYEVFVTNDPEDRIDIKKYKKGIIKKKSKGRYNLIVENGEEKTVIEDISKTFDEDYGTLSRFVSMSLRHRVPIEFIIDQLSRDKNFFGFERAISRILKKYLHDDIRVLSNNSCPNCGESDTMVFQGGCKTCNSCGYAVCD